jgi:hypothetical protein
VNVPTQKYENMYNVINNKSNSNSLSNNLSNNLSNEYKIVDLLPKSDEPSNMKNELKNFLKKQLSEPSKTNIDFMSPSSSNSFSMF